MRTVSFSSPDVRNLLNNQFINVFTDTTGDPTAGRSIGHAPGEPAGFCIRGNGQQNVQTIFMTPAGEIFHVATGFLSPEELATEVRFALQVFHRISSVVSDNRKIVVDAHRQRLSDSGFDSNQISSRIPMQMMMSGTEMPGMSQLPSSGDNPAGKLSAPDMDNVFSGFVRQQFLTDNRFSMDYPLITWKSLQEDPAKLVGNGQSFFSSSSSGSPAMAR